ncbi:amidohydrolase family protein [Mycobacterium sp. CVI_P3]|uniref:Amidohydrolase family protein n=1 Tax=Mycobacterium pinniadriaticum TaxID=2994102 RepID=A0ABT3SG31_9MYCO|nr:amidohydrolase family protein [Mycobacterium pinniadriaticum]MCX2931431.1 amidohydrolase family protein [Mycobacterium pinniadriaticum]MCX2937855.1 amidohydrolase family protein [Mycobacterium pinniadriaticum]
MLIALEEHYAWNPPSSGNVVATWLQSHNPTAYQRLYDRGSLRLEQMDAAGIDFQILSLFDPGVQEDEDTARAVDNARRANDDLAETVRATPDRFGGFATLATQEPDAAAAELERAVEELGLVGGLINGHTRGRYLDDPAYLGLFECAQHLGVPIYLHPTTPHPAVMDAWFAPYVKDGLHLASWGFAAETGTHALRLIYSGLFDKFPRLQMILGHLGEMLPYAAYRLDRYYGLGGGDDGGQLAKRPSQYLCDNFHITTSGNFSPTTFACALEVMGPDRLMFSVDYPMDDNVDGAQFLRDLQVDDDVRRKIAGDNALGLFGDKIPRR